MTLVQILQERETKDEFFKTDINSPLSEEQMELFDSLAYYDYDPKLQFEVKLELFEPQESIQVFSTHDCIRNYVRYGEFRVDVDGGEVRLTIYKTSQGYFLPFTDANAGTETYPAGRYLDLESEDGVNFCIDFNRAYNPLCAYTPLFDCPITPKENRLKVAIRAGEKMPIGDWVENKNTPDQF